MFKFIQMYKVNYERLGLERKIDFIFDDQMRAKRRVVKAWDFFRKPGNEELHDFMGDYPVFKNELEVLPLQAADMLAWCLRRQIADHHSGSPPRPMPWPDRDNIKSLALRYQEDALRGEYVAMFEGLE